MLRGKDTLQFAFDLGNDGKFGIYFGSTERLELAFRKYSFGEAIPAGIAKGAQTISSYLKPFSYTHLDVYKRQTQ